MLCTFTGLFAAITYLLDLERKISMNHLTTESEVEKSVNMGSYNHSYIQANLIWLLKNIGKYAVLTELSLDISNVDLSQFSIKTKEEIKPDVCIYPKRGLSRPDDILKMSEMPLLVIEILSPKQGTYDILQKFKVYFALGIKSCWLVEPAIEVVTVYPSIDKRKNFINDKVLDEVLDISLSIPDIFE